MQDVLLEEELFFLKQTNIGDWRERHVSARHWLAPLSSSKTNRPLEHCAYVNIVKYRTDDDHTKRWCEIQEEMAWHRRLQRWWNADKHLRNRSISDELDKHLKWVTSCQIMHFEASILIKRRSWSYSCAITIVASSIKKMMEYKKKIGYWSGRM